jgi:hypothetical protein
MNEDDCRIAGFFEKASELLPSVRRKLKTSRWRYFYAAST